MTKSKWQERLDAMHAAKQHVKKYYDKPEDVPDDGGIYEWDFKIVNGGLPLIQVEDAEFEVISSKLKS